MDFRQNSQAPTPRTESVSVNTNPSDNNRNEGKFRGKIGTPKWLNLLAGLALFGVVVLLLTAAFALARGKDGVSNEADQVKTSQYQAVFLNNGQVYFGNISDLNGRYLTLKNVYYLTQSSTNTNTQTTSGDYTLVKLGCQQIHYPDDQMIISREQVTFWENLNTKGKVATSIAEFKKQNPNGPNCTEVTSQTPAANTPSQSTPQASQQTTPTTKP